MLVCCMTFLLPASQAEDDGWVLTMVYDTNTNRTYLAILDGRDVAAGPVAKVHLPHHIPFGECELHCNLRSATWLIMRSAIPAMCVVPC